MARILIAWELGAAFGHLVRCLKLADALAKSGHRVVMVLREIKLPPGESCPPGVLLVPTPLTPPRQWTKAKPVNYAELLTHCGFAEASNVAARLVAWEGLFSLIDPEVLIADHAPTALLAAARAGIKHVAFGNAFAIPPAIHPWPSIRPWEAVDREELIQAEARLDQVTDQAQKMLGNARPVRLREVFGEYDTLDTFSELDQYGVRRGARYVGPIVAALHARVAHWQQQGTPKIIAYLRPEVPGFRAILEGLALVEAEVLCVVPGLPAKAAKEKSSGSLRIALVPLDLPPLLAEADLAFSYGNCGFSTQALLAGVPLLMSPIHVEQGLFAQRVEAINAGVLLDGAKDAQRVKGQVDTVLNGSDFHRAADAFKHRYQSFSSAKAVKDIVTRIEHTIAGSV